MYYLAQFSPGRVWLVFRFLLTVFLLIRRIKRFLLLRPLSPAEFKQTIIDLGASFIKLAQVLATRADFFPTEYLVELRELHDEIPPMSQEELDTVWKRAFKHDPFEKFERKPLASASIGQVHEAILLSGEKVAVKFRREGIESRVKADILILKFFNFFFQPLFSPYTKHSVESVISEFSTMLLKEVSLHHEMYNLITFADIYEHSDVKFPIPYQEYCTDDALVMSFMEGTRFDDLETLRKKDLDFKQLMEKLVQFYTEQILVEGYFHADPHPGNLLVDDAGNLVLLDFGMIKKLSSHARLATIDLVLSANSRNYPAYIAACKRLGVIAEDAPEEEMQAYAEQMFDIFGNKNLSAMNMQELGFEVLRSMKNMPFKLPQEAVYILRAGSIIEGLGTNFVENFNGIKDILPILRKEVPKALGSDLSAIRSVLNEVQNLPRTVIKIREIIDKLNSGQLTVRVNQNEIKAYTDKFHSYVRGILLGAGLVVTAFFLVFLGPDYHDAAIACFAGGSLILAIRI